MTRTATLTIALFCLAQLISAQTHTYDLNTASALELRNVKAEPVTFKGERGLRLTISDAAARQYAQQQGDQNRIDLLAVVQDAEFSNGVIEAEIAGSPAPGVSGGARGFVGIAFRVQDEPNHYDAFYLRPTNGRADDQERRNHSAQYISHPEWPWFRLREETPSRYETYVDIAPDEWIAVRIEVDGEKARLSVNGAEQPTLVVNDVKSGPDGKGKVGLWLEGSTVAHFRNLRITPH